VAIPPTVIALSPQQEAVVNYRGAHLQVIACAGSGKTESISRRIAALTAEGVAPESIVAFTFTERAAAELKDRVARRVKEEMGESFLNRLGRLFVGTIHSFCFRLLQTHVPRYGNYDVLDEHRHAGLLSREYRRLGLANLGSPKHWQPIRDFSRTADIIANEMIDVSRLEGTQLGDCYQAYREMLDRYHFLTFGQIIDLAVGALEAPQVHARVHGPLRYLFVDEYQDINPAQERLIELLARDPVQLCVVGDDDQSIYQWRGADVTNILQFRDRYNGSQTLPLDTNRRSRPQIIETANSFAQTIRPRLGKAMVPSRTAGDPQIVAWSAETPEEEAEQVADTIVRLHAEGFAYRDLAVLFRSVRTSAPPLVEALRRLRVPFRCGGRTGLFLQPEIALCGEIHTWFVDGQWKDGRYEKPLDVNLDAVVAGLESVFNGGEPLPWLKQYLIDWKKDRLSGKQPVSLVGDFYRFLYRLGMHNLDLETPEASARFGAFARFSQVLADFEHVTRRGRYITEGGQRVFIGGRDRGKDYARQVYNYLLHYARDAYEEFEGEESVDLDAVDILTVHQAKGLEWPVVFLPALVEGRFPSRRAGQIQQWLLPENVFPRAVRQRYEGSETEERRLFYVAITRARDCVYLSHFHKIQRRFEPSPFLTEISEEAPVHKTLPIPTPERLGNTVEQPLQLSFSDIVTFEDCGFRYRLGIVFGFQQELAVELGYGKAIHHVLRQVAELARERGQEPSRAEIDEILEREFYLPFANQATVRRMSNAAQRLVMNYIDNYSDDLHRVWATERPFELHLPSGTLAGRADVILGDEGSDAPSLAIVDYKTATDPRREEYYRLQLAVYTAAGRGEGLDVTAAYLHNLNAGVRAPVDISQDETSAAVERVASATTGIRRGEYEAKPEPQRCNQCDYWRVCRHADRSYQES